MSREPKLAGPAPLLLLRMATTVADGAEGAEGAEGVELLGVLSEEARAWSSLSLWSAEPASL